MARFNLSNNRAIYDNTQRDVIAIMPDTLDNKLRDFETAIHDSIKLEDFGLPFALLATLLTTEKFHDFLGIHGSVWNSIFCVALFFFILRLCIKVVGLIKKKVTRDTIISELMNEGRKLK